MILRIRILASAIAIMLLLGTISLITSIGYNSSILVFIGLGLVFWGAILLYVKPEEYARKTLLEAVLSPSLTTLNQMIQELGYKGDRNIPAPKILHKPRNHKDLYIRIQTQYRPPNTRTNPKLREPTRSQNPTRLVNHTNRNSIVKTVRRISRNKLHQNRPRNLQQKLPNLIIEDLEIAENLEIQEENDPTERKEYTMASGTQGTHMKNTTIHAKITKPIYENMLKDAEDPSQLASSITCPLRSAIAIAITKATGKPVRIADTKDSEDGNIIEATFEVIED